MHNHSFTVLNATSKFLDMLTELIISAKERSEVSLILPVVCYGRSGIKSCKTEILRQSFGVNVVRQTKKSIFSVL